MHAVLEEAGMSFPDYSSLGVQLYLSLFIKSIISNAKKCNFIHELYGEEILWWFPVKQGWGTLVSCRF